ncbi:MULTISPECIES: peptidoglycan-binding domain-containing protein [unclassified Kitasatospora]|uniref:peptidoglycan-binding domain-containing protein n=1 Tax=unclassified Kitasatospora TaxID=2633591 RepID=UPI0033EDA850
MRKIVIGLAATGLLLAGTVATAGTANAAGSRCGEWSTSEPLLKVGATGDAVRELQCELNYSINPDKHAKITVDGVFGQDTLNSVYFFQKCMGYLQVDGQVGPQTWGALDWWSSVNAYPNC